MKPTPQVEDLPISKTAMEKINVDAVVHGWNQVAKAQGFKPTRGKSVARGLIAKRLRNQDFFDNWRECCDILIQGPVSPHLKGQNDSGWVADLDWFLTTKALSKILDGSWTQQPGLAKQPPQRRHDLSGFKEVGDGF